MTADVPRWDPDTFRPTHLTPGRARVQAIDSVGDAVSVRCANGRIYAYHRDLLTPIPEPVTAREQWGYIDVEGDFMWRTNLFSARKTTEGRPATAVAQLKAIDGQLVLCDEHGTPVQVAP